MSLASNALTTVSAVKVYLGIPSTDTSQDVLLEDLVNSFSAFAEKFTGRKFGISDYDETYAGTETQELILKQYPVNYVTSVTDTSIFDVDTPITDYTIKSESGILFRNNFLWYKCPLIKGLSKYEVGRQENYEVVYNAGYVLPKDDSELTPRTLPYDLEMLTKTLVINRFNRLTQGADGFQVFRMSDLHFQWDTDDLTPQQMKILTSYKRHRV